MSLWANNGGHKCLPVNTTGGHKCLPAQTTGGTQVSSGEHYRRGGTQVSYRSNDRGDTSGFR